MTMAAPRPGTCSTLAAGPTGSPFCARAWTLGMPCTVHAVCPGLRKTIEYEMVPAAPLGQPTCAAIGPAAQGAGWGKATGETVTGCDAAGHTSTGTRRRAIEVAGPEETRTTSAKAGCAQLPDRTETSKVPW